MTTLFQILQIIIRYYEALMNNFMPKFGNLDKVYNQDTQKIWKVQYLLKK